MNLNYKYLKSEARVQHRFIIILETLKREALNYSKSRTESPAVLLCT